DQTSEMIDGAGSGGLGRTRGRDRSRYHRKFLHHRRSGQGSLQSTYRMAATYHYRGKRKTARPGLRQGVRSDGPPRRRQLLCVFLTADVPPPREKQTSPTASRPESRTSAPYASAKIPPPLRP